MAFNLWQMKALVSRGANPDLALAARPPAHMNSDPPSLWGNKRKEREGRGARASLASCAVDVEESPTAPFGETTFPGRDKYAAPEGEWAGGQLRPSLRWWR